MGYYTRYALTIADNEGHIVSYEGNEALFRKIANDLRDINNSYFSDEHDLDDFVRGEWTDEWKWYDNQEDILALSEKNPDYIFIVNGEGEEQGDLWCKYFYNGDFDVVTAIIKFEEPTKDFAIKCEKTDWDKYSLAEYIDWR